MRTITPEEKAELEELSKKFHDIYQLEAHRQEDAGIGKARHYDEYEKLSEPVKEFDRVLARYVLGLLSAAEERGKLALVKEPEEGKIPYYNAVIAQAEERGRRRGIEEARKVVEGMSSENPNFDEYYAIVKTGNMDKMYDYAFNQAILSALNALLK